MFISAIEFVHNGNDDNSLSASAATAFRLLRVRIFSSFNICEAQKSSTDRYKMIVESGEQDPKLRYLRWANIKCNNSRNICWSVHSVQDIGSVRVIKYNNSLHDVEFGQCCAPLLLLLLLLGTPFNHSVGGP